ANQASCLFRIIGTVVDHVNSPVVAPQWNRTIAPAMAPDGGIHWKVHLLQHGRKYPLPGIRIKSPNRSSLSEVEITSGTRHVERSELSSCANCRDFACGKSDFSKSGIETSGRRFQDVEICSITPNGP